LGSVVEVGAEVEQRPGGELWRAHERAVGDGARAVAERPGHGFARSCARCASCDRHASAMPFAMPSRADLDGNGVVDAVDLALLFLALAVPIGQIARFEPRTSNWTEL